MDKHTLFKVLPHRLVFATLVLFVFAIAGCPGSSCDEGNATRLTSSATVSFVSITPTAAYPGIPFKLSFNIIPRENTDASELSWRVDFGDGETKTGEDLTGVVTSYAYKISGDFTIKVEALQGSDVVGDLSFPFTVYSPIDLAVSSVRAQPANINVGEELTVTIDVANTVAVDVQTPFHIGLYLSTEDALTVAELADATKLGSFLIEAAQNDEAIITSGMARAVVLKTSIPTTLASNQYHLYALLDDHSVILDTNPDNNLGSSNAALRLTNDSMLEPDLIARDIVIAPDRAFPELNRVTRRVTISNLGGIDIFEVVAETYLSIGDNILDASDVKIHTSTPVQMIAAKRSVDLGPDLIILNQTIVPPPGQELEIYVIVKVFSTDPQSTEIVTNNNEIASPNPIILSDQLVEGPDISVRKFVITPEQTFLNGTLEFTLDIANEGNLDVSSFFCGVYLGKTPNVNTTLDERLINIQVASLQSNEEKSIVVSKTIPGIFDPGQYYLYIVCDPLAALSEPFRSNNELVFPNIITITDEADVDLRVDTLTIPSDATENDTVEIVAKICVDGTNPSGQTTAKLFRTPGTLVNFNSDAVATTTVPNINPGECANVPIAYTVSCDQFQENYAFGLQIDTNDRLPETDEENNSRVGSNILKVSGSYCACTEDAFEPNDRPLDAKPLVEGTNSGALCVVQSCDYFKTPKLGVGDSIVVRNTHEPDKGVLATTLFDPSGVNTLTLDRNESGTQEVADFLIPTVGEYIVSVCGAQTNTRNFYELHLEIIPQAQDVDLVARSLTLPQRDSFSVGAIVPVTFSALNIGRTDSTSIEAQVVISTNNMLGDADDVQLLTTTIEAIVASGQRDETLNITIPTSITDGEYTLGVLLDPYKNQNETNTLNNIIHSNKITVATNCYDALEPNDNFGDARKITSGSFSNIDACGRADDFYTICPGDGKKLTISLDFTSSTGDLDLELYNDQFQRVASSTQTHIDSEQVVVPYVNGNQCYYARIYLLTVDPEATTQYQLNVDISNVDPSLQCSSVYEPNETFATASSLLSATTQAQTLDRCPSTDTDFYTFDIGSPGQNITIRGIKDPAQQAGTLRLQIYNPNQTVGPNVETAPDQPTASISNFTAPSAGRYYLQVIVSGNTRNVTYKLEVDGLSGVDLTPRQLLIGPGNYRINDEVRFGFELLNLGATEAMATEYKVYMGTSATHDIVHDVLLHTFTPPNVPGNGSISIVERVFVPSAINLGTHYIHIVVNPTGDINTNNNITSIQIPIVP